MDFSKLLKSLSLTPTPNVEPTVAQTQCGPLPGTLVRIFIPPGAVINLLNLIEVVSPSGICLIIRLPFLDEGSGSTALNIQSIINAVRAAGGTVVPE